MSIVFSDIPGHEGFAAPVLADGTLSQTSAAFVQNCFGYQAACSCGWTHSRRYPPTPEGAKSAEDQWYRHAQPLLALAPPSWVVVKADLLCQEVARVVQERPRAALSLLARVDSWQRALTQQAVAAARSEGASWADIGTALGISKQAAHERFRDSDVSG
ncbi:hypothetical protein [Nonomuraea sp. NPDC046570]|uniref:hypothetical protein n=1 Tax=Nonomuraea sp. NPDC046570 TaxID=3155255 RepID=UPI00340B75CD